MNMIHRFSIRPVVSFACLWILSAGVAVAQSSQIINKVKKATAFVKVEQSEMQGSAFCISSKGFFATCAHVLDGVDVGQDVSLVINSGTPAEKVLKARIMRKSRALDLAILKTSPGTAPALKLGIASKLKETDPVVVVGFPMGDALSFYEGNPSVTVSTGKVTSLRFDQKVVGRLQIDAKLIPGNSGGPVINRKGEVVGIAVSSIQNSSLNFAIGTAHLNRIIQAAQIVVDPIAPVSLADQHKPLDIKLKLDYLVPNNRKSTVKAYYIEGTSEAREVKVTQTGKLEYKVSGVPVMKNVSASSYTVRASFIRSGGGVRNTISMEIRDQKVSVGTRDLMLSDICMILPNQGVVLGHEGQVMKGVVKGVESIQRVDMTAPSALSLKNWHAVAFRPLRAGSKAVTLKIVVKDESYTLTDLLPIPIAGGAVSLMSQGSPHRSGFDPYAGNPELFLGDQKEIDLGGEAADVEWGGGGRYLVADIRAQRKLVVVDCALGKIAGEIPYGAENIYFGAGANALLIAKGNRVEHWSYSPVKEIHASTPWVTGEILGISVGAGAHQIVGVYYDVIKSSGLRRFEFRNFETGKLIAIEPQNASLKKGLHFTSSMTGHAYGAFEDAQSKYSNSEVYYAEFSEMAKAKYSRTGWLNPDPVEKYCYTAFAGAVLSGYESRSKSEPYPAMVATTMPGVVSLIPLPMDNNPTNNLMWGLYDTLRDQVLIADAIQLDEFDESKLSVKLSHSKEDPLSWNKRFFYNAHLGLLGTVPPTNRSVIVRKYDLWKNLQAKQKTYFYPLIYLPTLISRGDKISIQLKMASSSTDPLKYELIDCPDGMVCSADGLLEWVASDSVAGKTYRILAKISSQDGLEYLWQHNLSIQ